jgi:hypothetical protein
MLNAFAAHEGSSNSSTTDSPATTVDPYSISPPPRSASSLRASAFPDDAATAGTGDANQSSTPSDDSAISAAVMQIVLILLILLLVLQLSLYRFYPASVALWLDGFSWKNPAPVGGAMKRLPTQFGAAFTVAFALSGLLLALYLGSAPNVQRVTTLLPPSTVARAGSATADLEITVRAFIGAASIAAGLCADTDTRAASSTQLLSGSSGFSKSFHIRTSSVSTSGACHLAASCVGCTLLGSSSSVSLRFPFSAQLLEWEVQLSGAAPASAARRYGVLTQQPGQMIDAQGEIAFSVTEGFYTDSSHSAGITGSGYELDFSAYRRIEAQSLSDFSSASQVRLTISFSKSPVVMDTSVTRRLSLLQVLASVLSAVISLLGLFAFVFSLLVGYVFPSMRLVTGHVVDQRDRGGKLFIRENGNSSDAVSKFRSDNGDDREGSDGTEGEGWKDGAEMIPAQLPLANEADAEPTLALPQTVQSPSGANCASSTIRVWSPSSDPQSKADDPGSATAASHRNASVHSQPAPSSAAEAVAAAQFKELQDCMRRAEERILQLERERMLGTTGTAAAVSTASVSGSPSLSLPPLRTSASASIAAAVPVAAVIEFEPPMRRRAAPPKLLPVLAKGRTRLPLAAPFSTAAPAQDPLLHQPQSDSAVAPSVSAFVPVAAAVPVASSLSVSSPPMFASPNRSGSEDVDRPVVLHTDDTAAAAESGGETNEERKHRPGLFTALPL